MSSTLLITTATQPPEGIMYLQTTDVATRWITGKGAVFFWAMHGIEKIVIADATGNTLLSEEEVSMLAQMDVAVEQISYRQDNEAVRERGKGYAEGMLIKFALENSELLSGETSFFKCTGKVYCRNFAQVREMIDDHQVRNIFWQGFNENGINHGWADMRFFYASKDFFHRYLLPTYFQCDDRKGAIEAHCYHLFRNNLATIRTARPLLVGFCAGTGRLYEDMSLGFLDDNFPCWLST